MKLPLFNYNKIGLFGLILTIANVGCAENPPQPPRSAPPPEPPEQAKTACSGKTQTESCSFLDRQETLVGTCQVITNLLVCVPANHPPPQNRK